jgi:hypothetical protein
MEARNRGVVFIDDSPENLKSPSSFNQFTSLDLTRTQEIQARYTLAQQIKNECWELIGMSRQRLGSVQASESATGTQAAITQSYAQTEPLFVAHEYIMGQLYQAVIDAALYVESAKPQSTISYITSEGESAFVSVNGTDLRFRDLKVYLTNRPEDKQMFNEIRGLSQAVIQNGGSLHDVIELYSTNSIRQMKRVFKTLKDRQEQLQDQQMQQKQQELQQQQQIAQAQIESTQQQAAEKVANENYNAELDRINKKEIALIAAESKSGPLSDIDASGDPDVLEIEKIAMQKEGASMDYRMKLQDAQSKNRLASEKLQVEREKIQVSRENQTNDLAIAKENAKGRAKAKPKTK